MDNIGELEQINYLKYQLILVCNKKHPLIRKKIVSLRYAAKYPLSMIDTTSRLYTIVAKAFAAEGIKIKVKNLTTKHKILLEILQF
mgnify:CR=1 FL=1